MISYDDTMKSITSLLTRDELVSYSIQDDYQYGVENGIRLILQDDTTYSVWCLGDNMMNVGKMYDQISQTNARFFK